MKGTNLYKKGRDLYVFIKSSICIFKRVEKVFCRSHIICDHRNIFWSDHSAFDERYYRYWNCPEGYIRFIEKGIQMMICALLSLICGLLYARYASKAITLYGEKLRSIQYAKIQEYAFINLDHFETSSLITRLTSDVTVIQNSLVNGIRPLPEALWSYCWVLWCLLLSIKNCLLSSCLQHLF